MTCTFAGSSASSERDSGSGTISCGASAPLAHSPAIEQTCFRNFRLRSQNNHTDSILSYLIYNRNLYVVRIVFLVGKFVFLTLGYNLIRFTIFALMQYPHVYYKKLSYRWGTAQCVVSVEILPVATQQCRNYLYDKSWTKYQLSLIDPCDKIVL